MTSDTPLFTGQGVLTILHRGTPNSHPMTPYMRGLKRTMDLHPPGSETPPLPCWCDHADPRACPRHGADC